MLGWLFKKTPDHSKRLFVPGPKYETRLVQLLRTVPEVAAQHISKKTGEFLPVFIHPFLLDETCKEPFDTEVMRYYSDGFKLLLDFSTESLIFHEDSHFFSRRLKDLHEYLADAGMDTDRLYLLNANSAAQDGYAAWSQRHHIQNPMHILSYDFYLYESSQAIAQYYNKSGLFSELQERFNAAKPRTLAFSCLNLKAKPHRWAVAAKLLSCSSKDNMTFSFLEAAGGENKKACDSMIAQMPDSKVLQQAAASLEQSLPVTLDYANIGDLQQDIYKLPNAEGVWESLLLFNQGSRVLLESYIDVVNETWFTDASCCFFSEKTLRPLVTLKPFILVGCPFSLKRLQHLGYQTFHPYINESYDEVADPIARMRAIHLELERLSAMSLTQLHEMQMSLKDRLLHNYHHALGKPKVNSQLLSMLEAA